MIFRGGRSIWWHWKVAPVAPLIVNDVSYLMMINHESQFWVAGAVIGDV